MSVSGSGTVNYGHVAQKDDQKIESYGLKELGWDKVPTGLNSFLCHSQNVPSGILIGNGPPDKPSDFHGLEHLVSRGPFNGKQLFNVFLIDLPTCVIRQMLQDPALMNGQIFCLHGLLI